MGTRVGAVGIEPTVWRLGRHRGQWVAISGSGEVRKRVSLRTEDRASAERAIRELNGVERQRAAGTNATTGDLYALYLKDRERDGKDIRRMRQAWKPLALYFETVPPEHINKIDVQRYIKARRQLGVTDGAIRTELSYLHAALRLAMGERAPRMERPPQGRPRERALSRDEAEKLIEAAIEPHVRLWLILALATGGRPSHILQLTWDRVDLRRREINLDDPERDRTAKGRARVPINDMALQALQEAREVAQTGYVIEMAGKAPIASVKKGVASAARRAGIGGVTPYVMRHTTGVWLAEDGVPMEEIAQYLGHTSLNTTRQHYARYSPTYLRRAARSLNIGTAVPARTDDDVC